MNRFRLRLFVWLLLAFCIFGLIFGGQTRMFVMALQPTDTPPAITETASDIYITVTYNDQINVRAGPNTIAYPIVGYLKPGDTAMALGKSPGSDWIQISFPGAPGGVGWVYISLVSLTQGFLRVVEPPPTETPLATSTIDPTLAAAFNFEPTVTRLPTFTPPPPLVVPTFSYAGRVQANRFPAGTVILGLMFIGGLGLLTSYLGRH